MKPKLVRGIQPFLSLPRTSKDLTTFLGVEWRRIGALSSWLSPRLTVAAVYGWKKVAPLFGEECYRFRRWAVVVSELAAPTLWVRTASLMGLPARFLRAVFLLCWLHLGWSSASRCQ